MLKYGTGWWCRKALSFWFQITLSFSKCAFIFKMRFCFQNHAWADWTSIPIIAYFCAFLNTAAIPILIMSSSHGFTKFLAQAASKQVELKGQGGEEAGISRILTKVF